MKTWAWLSFWALGIIWGSSFLLISIGVEDVPATQLVFVRIAIAAVFLNLIRVLKHKPLPHDWGTTRAFILIGVGNTTIPYTLISLGEQNISSGMAAVLQSGAALFTLIFAHFAFTDERITVKRALGLAIGFAGIIVLSSKSLDGGELDVPTLLGQGAVILACVFYASCLVYSRKVINRNIDPIVVSSGTFVWGTISAIVFMVLEPVFGGRAYVPFHELPTNAILAITGLGFINTFIAYLFFYFIIQQLGAFRASMVTYITPVVGLFLGWLVLEEVVDITLLVGAMMIFAGIAIINLRFKQMSQYGQRRLGMKTSEART